jgi:FKBP-type peptidyl-prolyl cis-trans isomerase
MTQFVLMPTRLTIPPPAATMRLVLCLLPILLLGACLTEPKRCEDHPTNPATEHFDASLGVDLSTMEKTELGDYRKDLVVGTGAQLSTLGPVQIHYSAYLSNGQLIDPEQDLTLDLRTNATLGLADGMLDMFVGGQRLIVSPSQNAQGACGNAVVPGNSTVIYKVQLLAID